MVIRTYQPGDEQAQARIYNTAAGTLPAFKPASPEEIARRYEGDDDPGSRFYAEVDGDVVGYAVACASGRISYPWCLPGAEAVREPLLSAVLLEMGRRGLGEAWATYRADWSAVLDFLRDHGFVEKRQMINYLADVSRLQGSAEIPEDRVIEPVARDDVSQLAALAPRLFSGIEPRSLESFFWENPYYDFSESFFALKERRSGKVLGACLLVVSDRFADPSKIDAAMPCFRLGAFGTERERHKRVNGLFSCAFADESEGELLLSAPDWERARQLGPDPCRRPGSLGFGSPLRLLRPHLPAPGGLPDPLETPDALTTATGRASNRHLWYESCPCAWIGMMLRPIRRMHDARPALLRARLPSTGGISWPAIRNPTPKGSIDGPVTASTTSTARPPIRSARA